MRIRILKPGLLATLQDLGRPGLQAAGVPQSGAADADSHRTANIVLGNGPEAASLEIVPGPGWSAEALTGGWCALCGAGGKLLIDHRAVYGCRPVYVPPGSRLDVRAAPTGTYAYLAVRGGWAAKPVLDSRSTCLAAGFGGYNGRALQENDDLEAYTVTEMPGENRQTRWFATPEIPHDTDIIRILPGPEWSWWPPDEQVRFLSTTFTVSLRRDRMGMRLEGTALTSPVQAAGMLSSGVMPGVVQAPPDGQPFVLLADCQTTGGYPRLAQVIAVDLPRLAQKPAGKPCRFRLVELEAAEQSWFARERYFQKLQLAVRLCTSI